MDNLTPNPASATTPPAPNVDFSYSESLSLVPLAPANGIHLCKLAAFEPANDQESGLVSRWSLTLDAAEPIPDNQKPPGEIAEGSRLGTFSIFMSPSQFTTLEDCAKLAVGASFAFANIALNMKTDPGYVKAKQAWAALPPEAKRPVFTGTPPMLDSDPALYAQHVGKLVLVRFATTTSKEGSVNTRVKELLAPSTPRKGAKP